MWQLVMTVVFVLNSTPMTIDVPIGGYEDETSCTMMLKFLSNPHSGIEAKFRCSFVPIESL